ncbi:MAG: hypothetical protein KAR42_09370 [candidate division Zixibacteria bacterium]|nr:hypothetical protein [candidate division Zixibacteria bacterium]
MKLNLVLKVIIMLMVFAFAGTLVAGETSIKGQTVTTDKSAKASQCCAQGHKGCTATAKKNCDPKKCDPKNCDPKNCDPKNCDPKNCASHATDKGCPSGKAGTKEATAKKSAAMGSCGTKCTSACPASKTCNP